MNSDDEKESAHENAVPARNEKKFRWLWLAIAGVALVAAFLFQWKNGIDQASISETDDGRFVRAKVENDAFRLFSGSPKRQIREAFLYGSDGELLARLVPAKNDLSLFRLAEDADFSNEKFRTDRYLRLLLPEEKNAGNPVVLLVENPFRGAGTPAGKQ